MKNFGKVRRSIEPKAIEINGSNVFLAKNITPYKEEIDGYILEGYEFDYIIYDKDEYIQMLAAQNEDLQNQLLQTQVALCDIYEAMGGNT